MSDAEYKDYMVKVGCDQHELIVMPKNQATKTKEPKEGITLEDFMNLKSDKGYSDKFNLYSRKNKLKELVDEYKTNNADYKATMHKTQPVFWCKLEKCDSIIDNLDRAFEVISNIYSNFIGFKEDADIMEKNPNMIIETLVDLI